MELQIEESWKQVLASEFEQTYFKNLWAETQADYLVETVYPPQSEVFNAFAQCPFSDVSVVILGQDPYHGPQQANGLAFSVHDSIRIPPSLRNIYKEIKSDVGAEIPESGNLERWAKQGVLLLNATLTVAEGRAGSHQGRGWETFTDAVIEKLSEDKNHLVFMLWGNFAKQKGATINREKHLIIEAAHPSPLSAYNGFFGCKHFSQANTYLVNNQHPPIQW